MATEEKNPQEKLTYEQLKAYAAQTTVRAKQIFEENQMLKQALQEARIDNNFKEIDLVLKCLDHKELFSKEFIDSIVKRLEELLTPAPQEAADKDPKEEKED